MSNTAPLVSVVIPCYNLGRYLDEAVDSVLGQSFADVEIVVVDDGSTDPETQERLSTYSRPRTRLIGSANRGLPAAKNLGLAHTSGPYVCMLDADDRLEPTFLEKSVAVLDADPSVTFVSHWLRTFGDETWEWTPTDCGFPALLDVNTVNGAALVRRTALQAVGGFDETMRDGCEDWDIWIALVESGFKGRILPEFLFQYRRRAESMSRVMMRGDGHPRLYRRLAEKHARSYRDHLEPLLARRERDLSNLRRHVHDLELEHYGWLGPELQKWREDVEILERKAARADRKRLEEHARRAAEQSLEREQNERVRLEEALRDAGVERGRLDAALRDASVERDRLEAAVVDAQNHRQVDRRQFEEEREQAQAALHDLGSDLAQARVERDHHERAFETARERALQLDADLHRHERAFERARERALQLDIDLSRASGEIVNLHSSMSWRMTAPLRAVYRVFRRIAGRSRG